MKSRWIAALLSAAALSLALSACGGGGGSGESSSSSTSSTPPTKETSTEAPSESSGALTPPGTTLPLGKEATVAWLPFGEQDPTKAQAGLELKASVLAIEKRSIGDLEGLELEPEEEEKTPYFVKVKLEALGSKEPPADEQPGLEFDAIDDRGQEQSSVTVLGEFPGCEENLPPKPFTSGAGYESCFIYLVRSGGSIDKVEWRSGPTEANAQTAYYEEPVVWEGG
jgi:hypothetical protein